jgi:hypothetical protein
MIEELPCGHTPDEHAEMDELHGMIHEVQRIEDPRLALIVQDTGEVHYASSLNPGEAAQMLEELARRVRRYGGNFVHDHFDRGRAAQWN